MVLPNSYLMLEDAKNRQCRLLEEAEAYRMVRDAHPHSPGRPHQLRRQFGNLLILAGKWLRGEDEQTSIGRHHTPASA